MRAIVPPGRVVGLDAARGLALLGMMATHVLPGVAPDGSVPLAQQVAGGRASALFAVLAGASLALMSGRTTPVRGRERVAVSAGLAARAAVIAAVGLALAEVGSGIAVILTYYGLLFLLGLPFLGMRAPALFVLSGAWLVAVPVLSHLVRPELPPRGFGSPSFGMLRDPWQLLTELTFTGYYPVVPWLAYLLVGMALGRLELTRWRTAGVLALAGGALAVAAWWTSELLLSRPGVTRTLAQTFTGPGWLGSLEPTLTHGLYGSTPTGTWWWLAVHAPHTATPFDLAHTVGSALLVVGACLALGKLLPRPTAVVLGAGAMTLSLYTLHVVLRAPGAWDGDDMRTYLWHVGLVLVIGAVFRLLGQSGPLERFVADLARGTANAVRRSEAARSPTGTR